MTRDIGLALSGGGFRAAAFHLGCLRALNDRDLLGRVRVISGVSGGSLLGALYAYGPMEFGEFDDQAVGLLRGGLQLAIARRALLSPRAPQALGGLASLPIHATRAALGQPHPLVRRVNRTTALSDVLATKLFGTRKTTDVTFHGLDTVLTACDLVTGGAVRFGSRVNSCSRVGDIVDDVRVADAVAASAAFPALLPALERRYRVRRRDGSTDDAVMVLTDGGVYDNLGLSVLDVDRDPAYTSHTYAVDYVIACDAGAGALPPRAPHIWPTRMKRVTEIMHGRAQHGARGPLFSAAASGRIKGFVYAYLGMRDYRLPVPVADLVPRDAVAAYPTDFRAMSNESMTALALRGEQLTTALLAYYCPQLT